MPAPRGLVEAAAHLVAGSREVRMCVRPRQDALAQDTAGGLWMALRGGRGR
jgi:hypothetical protein